MKNVGNVDRIVRVIIGVAVLSLYFILQGNARYFALIGLVPIITALIGYCPIYSIFGIRTCPAKVQSK